jgi:hypothetical protein
MFFKGQNDRFYDIAWDTDFASLLKKKTLVRKRDYQKLNILYEKESLLSPLPKDIICNRTQLYCEIFRQKFVFALENQLCTMNVFYQFVLYAVPIILISNESLRCHEQLYTCGARKWMIKNLKQIFLDIKK